jgi:hypothetical protein
MPWPSVANLPCFGSGYSPPLDHHAAAAAAGDAAAVQALDYSLRCWILGDSDLDSDSDPDFGVLEEVKTEVATVQPPPLLEAVMAHTPLLRNCPSPPNASSTSWIPLFYSIFFCYFSRGIITQSNASRGAVNRGDGMVDYLVL